MQPIELKEPRAGNDPSVGCDAWLGLVPDQVPVADLALPATHNSACVSSKRFHIGWSWAKCQTLSIADQLALGVRAFDLRLSDCFHEGQIDVTHTLCSSITLRQVVEVVARFLAAQPSEFVVLSLQRDWEHRNKWTEESDILLCETLHGILPLAFYSESQPTVGELRGQCLVCTKQMAAVGVAAGGWPEQFFARNDCWDLGSINATQLAVSAHVHDCLDENSTEHSTEGDRAMRWLGCNVVVGVRPPSWVAGRVNTHLREHLQQVYLDGGRRARSVGTIAVDFADAATVFAIVVCNFWVQFPAPQERVACFRSLAGEAGRSELHSGTAGLVVAKEDDILPASAAVGEEADQSDSWTLVQ